MAFWEKQPIIEVDMRKTLLSLLLPLFLFGASVRRGETALFILRNGDEFLGKVVLDNSRYLFLKVGDRIRQVKRSEVKRTVPAAELPAELKRRRKNLPRNADAYLKLAVFCRETGLLKEAHTLVEEALKLDPKHKGALEERAKLEKLDPRKIPWKPQDSVVLRVETKRRSHGKLRDDELLWSRLKMWLTGAKPPFIILPCDDRKTKADYVVLVEVEAKVVSENRFYGDIVLSRKWRGTARLYVLDPKSRRKLYIMKPVTVEENHSVSEPKVAEEMEGKAFTRLLEAVRKHPGFRLAESRGEKPVRTRRRIKKLRR